MPIRRKNISMKIKLEVALRQLGIDPANARLDHDPPLALRAFDASTGTYTPADDDPMHLRWLGDDAHKRKTTGRKGESKLSISYDGDISKIAKSKRLAKDVEAFRQRLLDKERGDEAPPLRRKYKWPKRPLSNKRLQHGQTKTIGDQTSSKAGRAESD